MLTSVSRCYDDWQGMNTTHKTKL